MKSKFQQAIENVSWYRQLVYGAILAAFFGTIILTIQVPFIWAFLQVVAVAIVKEHYMQDLKGSFNWRNFYLLQLPAILFYAIVNTF